MNYETFCNQTCQWVLFHISPEITLTRYPGNGESGKTDGEGLRIWPDLHFEAAKENRYSTVAVDIRLPELYDLFYKKDWKAVEEALIEELGRISVLSEDPEPTAVDEPADAEFSESVESIFSDVRPEFFGAGDLFGGEHLPAVPQKEEKRPRTVTKADDLRAMLDEKKQELFDRLRTLRRSIAQEHSVAPYIVFSNRSLYEMCKEMPETMQDLRKLRGVGTKNSGMYGDQFLNVIREFRETEELL